MKYGGKPVNLQLLTYQTPIMQKTIEDFILNYLDESFATPAKTNSHLRNDLKIDSLEVIAMSIAIEDRFEIHIPDKEIHKWDTVQDIIDYTYYLVSQKG